MIQLKGISIGLLVVLALLILQSLGGVFQIRNYKEAVKRVHKLGNVGIGQKRGSFLNGHVVIIACDNNGINTFLDKELIGTSIYEFLDITEQFSKKQFKKYKGYVRALEALEARLTGKELTREQEKYMEKKRKH